MKVAVLDDWQGVAKEAADWSRLPDAEVRFFREPLGGADAVAAALQPFDVVVAMRERTPFPASVVERLAALKLLVTTGMRNAAIDVAACRRRGVVVCGTRAAPGVPTAELTWGLILALVKRIPDEDRALRGGAWQTGLAQSVAGRRLGVVGLGKIGAVVAGVGQALGMRSSPGARTSPTSGPRRGASGGSRSARSSRLPTW
jgi:phosphoglycerate dehydrogenase-like enzyme